LEEKIGRGECLRREVISVGEHEIQIAIVKLFELAYIRWCLQKLVTAVRELKEPKKSESPPSILIPHFLEELRNEIDTALAKKTGWRRNEIKGLIKEIFDKAHLLDDNDGDDDISF
jgi:hypothetical protein